MACATTTAAPPRAAADLRTRLDAVASRLSRDGRLSGCLLVGRGDDVVYERGFGLADAELGVAAGPGTRFEIGSVAQVLTEIALARLVDEKKLARGDLVSRWLPRFPHGPRMTVAHLARHEAGIPSRVTTDDEEGVPRTPEDVVKLVATRPLLFAPGTRRDESLAGYAVLARVLEVAAGAPWGEVLGTRVFEPAGMRLAVHATSRDVIPGRASPHLPGPTGGIRPAPPKDLSVFVGSGAVVATARDLFSLVRALRRERMGPSAQAWAAERPAFHWSATAHGFATFVDDDARSGTCVVFTGNLPTPEVIDLRAAVTRLAAGR